MTYAPVLNRRDRDLGFMALSPPECPWRFAVLAPTPTEARIKYRHSLARWRALSTEATRLRDDPVAPVTALEIQRSYTSLGRHLIAWYCDALAACGGSALPSSGGEGAKDG